MNHSLPVNTPCIGLCSTVFGDTVCRGCLRHVHEIIDWNRYTPEQKKLVWLRLDRQIASVLPRLLRIVDARRMTAWMHQHRVPCRRNDSLRNVYRNAYDILRFCERRQLPLANCGFVLHPPLTAAEVQQELYALACAFYERDHLRAIRRDMPESGDNRS